MDIKFFKLRFRKLISLFLETKARQIRAARANELRQGPTRLVLLMCRPHDIELYEDIYHQAMMNRHIEVFLWVRRKALEKFKDTERRLKEKGMKIDFVVRHDNLNEALKKFKHVDALLNTVETTYAPHKIAYRTVTLANAAGVRTYTLQHAFENIGLTSKDPKFDSPEITFAANRIFTWGPTNNLPQDINPKTLKKCTAVGCPKKWLQHGAGKPGFDKPLIAVFEGLHAERFDDTYMESFFQDLQTAANQFTSFKFILKLHPNVLARSERHNRLLDQLNSIDIIAPNKADQGENLSTPELLATAAAVITTPSTIALDAAMHAKPVAVTRYDQPEKFYSVYTPLPLLNRTDDWKIFLKTVSSDSKPLQEISSKFLERTILPGDASKRILEIISRDCMDARKDHDAQK